MKNRQHLYPSRSCPFRVKPRRREEYRPTWAGRALDGACRQVFTVCTFALGVILVGINAGREAGPAVLPLVGWFLAGLLNSLPIGYYGRFK